MPEAGCKEGPVRPLQEQECARLRIGPRYGPVWAFIPVPCRKPAKRHPWGAMRPLGCSLTACPGRRKGLGRGEDGGNDHVHGDHHRFWARCWSCTRVARAICGRGSATGYDVDGIALGASIACDGVCLTVWPKGAPRRGAEFDVDIRPRRWTRPTSAAWTVGKRLNPGTGAEESANELGGHIRVGPCRRRGRGGADPARGRQHAESASRPSALAKFIAPRASALWR